MIASSCQGELLAEVNGLVVVTFAVVEVLHLCFES